MFTRASKKYILILQALLNVSLVLYDLDCRRDVLKLRIK